MHGTERERSDSVLTARMIQELTASVDSGIDAPLCRTSESERERERESSVSLCEDLEECK